jgi:hypothetical protein
MTNDEEILASVSTEAMAKILAFRGLHILCSMNPATNQLKAVYVASCLCYGPKPIWGVFTLDGEPRRFFASKAKVAEGFPRHVWRTYSSQWSLAHVDKQLGIKRTEEVTSHYKKKPKPDPEPVTEAAPVLH